MNTIVLTASWMVLSVSISGVLLWRQWVDHRKTARSLTFGKVAIFGMAVGMMPAWVGVAICVGKMAGVLDASLHDILLTSWKNVTFLICQTMGGLYGYLKAMAVPSSRALAVFGWCVAGAMFTFAVSVGLLLVVAALGVLVV